MVPKTDHDGPILEIDKLSISFFTRLREVPAVVDFSVSVQPGETVGLVGESGCGKSMVALGVMQDLSKNGRIFGGSIKFKGRDLQEMSAEELRDIRGSEIAMIYQEPMASLNLAMQIGRQLMEVPMIHQDRSDQDACDRALQVVTDVKLRDPADLLMEIQRAHKNALLFISHDLSIVRYFSDRVMVMYLEHVVELGTTDQVFSPPYHPHTEALRSSVPIADTKVKHQHIVLEGDIPLAVNPPPGCPFQTRCRWKSDVPNGLCEKKVAPVRMLAEGHQVKCHLADDILARMEPVIKIAAE